MRLLVPMILLLIVAAMPAWALDDGFSVEEVIPDLDVPVFFDFAPDGRIFFNEYTTGRVRVVDAQMNLLEEPLAQFDDVEVFFERGFLGLELDPDFADNHYLYLYYSSTDGTHKLVRIREEGNLAAEITYLRDDLPLMGEGNHNGGPIVFGPDRTLYLGIGEESVMENSQDLDVEAGKILRFDRDGSIPSDNPFGDDSAVWAYGIRNTFGLAFNPQTGDLYGSENGANTDDEVNLLVAGGNYGWPLYTGAPGVAGYEDALITWTPNICPTGIAVYCGANYPEEYVGDLFMGNCNGGRIRRMELNDDGTAIVEEDPTWYRQPTENLDDAQLYYGILDVVNGPDGNIWFSTALGIHRFVYDGAPAGDDGLDCDLFDGDNLDDDDSGVEYKKCTCTSAGGGPSPVCGLLLALAMRVILLRRR